MSELEELEKKSQELLNTPNISFAGLEVSVAHEIVEAISYILEKYPALRFSICAIGDNETVNNQFNMVKNSNPKKDIAWNDKITHDGILTTVSLVSSLPAFKKWQVVELMKFIAISYGNIIVGKNLDYLDERVEQAQKQGNRPEHCSNFRSMIYHEFGHVLALILNLDKDRGLYELIKEKSGDFREISTMIPFLYSAYSVRNTFDETIAEAFAEYIMCSNPNELVSSIGNYIDEKYRRFEKTGIFNINEKYRLHLVRGEIETSHNKHL